MFPGTDLIKELQVVADGVKNLEVIQQYMKLTSKGMIFHSFDDVFEQLVFRAECFVWIFSSFRFFSTVLEFSEWIQRVIFLYDNIVSRLFGH